MKLIDQLLDNAKDVIEKTKRPFVKSKIKRAFESGKEDLQEQIVNSEIRIRTLRGELVNNPEKSDVAINEILKEKNSIRKANLTIELLEEERKEWFENKSND